MVLKVSNDFGMEEQGSVELEVVAVLGIYVDNRAHDFDVDVAMMNDFVGFGACASKMVDVVDASEEMEDLL